MVKSEIGDRAGVNVKAIVERASSRMPSLESLCLCNLKQVISYTRRVSVKGIGSVRASEPFENVLYRLGASRFSSYLDDMNVHIWCELALLCEVEQSQCGSVHHGW